MWVNDENFRTSSANVIILCLEKYTIKIENATQIVKLCRIEKTNSYWTYFTLFWRSYPLVYSWQMLSRSEMLLSESRTSIIT